MPGEPLVVLHVALTEDISDDIQVRSHAVAGIWKGVSQFTLLYRMLKHLEFAVCSSTQLTFVLQIPLRLNYAAGTSNFP